MKAYIISSFLKGDENEISFLIKRVFDEFVAPDYTKEGNDFFYNFIKPANLLSRAEIGNLILTIKSEGKITGMIEVRDNFHICLLFVDKNHHGKGLSKLLFNKALDEIRKNSPYISFIEVNSSLYAIGAYKSLGFQLIGEMKEANGIKYFPMVCYLK